MVTGQIIPALAGVTVRMVMEGEEGENQVMEAQSDEKGVYVFPAIEQSAKIISFPNNNNNNNNNNTNNNNFSIDFNWIS